MRNAAAVVLLFASLTFAVSCGGGDQGPVSQAAPSTTAAPSNPASQPPPSTPSGAGASISGILQASSGMSVGGMRVEVLDTTVAATVNSAASFKLEDVPPGNQRLRITGSGVDATTALDGVRGGDDISIRIRVGGTSAVVEFDSRKNGPDDSARNEVELRGTITAKPAANQLSVAGQTIEIVPGTTAIQRGATSMTYADLKVGQPVEVRGTITPPATVVVASRISLEDNAVEPPEAEAEFTGVVGSPFPAGGSCAGFPMTLTVGGRTVRANGSTVFLPSCSAIKAGALLEVKGQAQADGSTLATRIAVEDGPDAAEVAAVGTVAGLTGSCAAGTLGFSVSLAGGGARQVQTDSATSFLPACAAVVSGASVEVEGVSAAGSTAISARKVKVEDAPGAGVETKLQGAIAGLGGACPALQFTLGTVTVKGSASTDYRPSCSALGSGNNVAVEGLLSGGVLMAAKIEKK